MRKAIILLLFSISWAINLSSYSIPGIFDYSNSTNESFNIGLNSYSLIKYNENYIFLIENNSKIIQNKTKIKNILNEYFSSKYGISNQDKEKLRAYFEEYNRSRNDGQKWKGSEEYSCRRALLIDKFPCYDNETCYNTSRLFLAIYAIAIGTDDITFIQPKITEFSNATFGTDYELEKINKDIDTLSDNPVEKLDDISKRIEKLEEYKEKIEGTLFRVPATGQDCPTCYGICPDLVLNGTALNKAKDKIKTIKKGLGPLAELENISKDIYNITFLLINEKNLSDQQKLYNQSFIIEKNKADVLIGKSNELLKKINDTNLKHLISNISFKTEEISNKIKERNLTNMSSELKNYSKFIKLLNESYNALYLNYKKLINYSKLSSMYEFLLDGETNEDDTIQLEVLKQKKKSYDEIISKGNISVSKLEELLSDYKELVNEEEKMIEKNKNNSFFIDIPTLSAEYVNSNIKIIGGIMPTKIKKRNEINIIYSVLFFLGILALLTFISFGLYAIINLINRTILVVLLIVALVTSIGISILFYLSLSNEKFSFSKFMNYAIKEKRVNLIIYPNQNTSIMECAKNISKALEGRGIESKIYSYDTNKSTCLFQGTIDNSCFEEPYIELKYNETNNIEYGGLGNIYITIYGNKEYFSNCPICDAIEG